MDKTLVSMGMGAIIIAIGFGVYDLIDGKQDMFYLATLIWTMGAIALVLGKTLFTKEEDSLIG